MGSIVRSFTRSASRFARSFARPVRSFAPSNLSVRSLAKLRRLAISPQLLGAGVRARTRMTWAVSLFFLFLFHKYIQTIRDRRTAMGIAYARTRRLGLCMPSLMGR
ncbi:hypothetical protein BU24DRAFT_275755 [Aaosphaeria arxii CBS 175.79]|uniref:Uncharacterized protein n=1 Tax=Aaosphaeria arxii CBS 175.79 TaxID=1450172 RepID=A0A6A5XHS3_9PLEO|nr:uncharacterized protein BU24DRAFT_275755 [Aaosphaeria arxii CBS 175.79]KAF2012371.1 hypothetical protein BU24DRAFT_275755 [Aaosphaeria arxii CBS 175.79]